MGCATQGRPSGGPKDTTPPKVVESKSTQNYQTNFEQREIIIEFDEFIKLKNVFKNVLISPPMLNFPEISERGKKLRIKFNPLENIRKDATYTINFGDAITDFHEGIPYPNYRFVFSTGDEIDSLTISGKVIDFKTKKPLNNIPVILYDNLEDSIIYKERPFYFAKTDENGLYEIPNVKSDTFQIFAIDDQNLNYYLDQESESIAFLDSSFVITDSFKQKINLELALVEPKLKITDKISEPYGKVTFKFNKPALDIPFQILDTIDYISSIDAEGLYIWYSNFPDSSIHINVLEDSLVLKLKSYQLDTSSFIPKITRTTVSATDAAAPGKWQEILFNTPIIRINRDSIRLLDTSQTAIKYQIKIDSIDQRKLLLKGSWKENNTYQISILPNAIENFYTLQNDSISLTASIGEKAKFGNLYPTLSSLDSTQQYLISLTKSDAIIDQLIIQNKSSQKLIFENLKPGKYKIKVIEDRNRNKKWDAANYQTKAKAEFFMELELPDLRANWDDESIIDISKIKNNE